MRPLGISCYEDKLVENAVAQILNYVYEPKFYNCSFGFRPARNCHMAVREIIEMVQYRKTSYIVEADMAIVQMAQPKKPKEKLYNRHVFQWTAENIPDKRTSRNGKLVLSMM